MAVLKKTSLAVIFLLILNSLSFSQTKTDTLSPTKKIDQMLQRIEPKIQELAKRDTEKMKRILALTDEQLKKAQEVRANYLRQNYRMKLESSLQKSENSKNFAKGMKGILTPQQQETYKQRLKDIFPKG